MYFYVFICFNILLCHYCLLLYLYNFVPLFLIAIMYFIHYCEAQQSMFFMMMRYTSHVFYVVEVIIIIAVRVHDMTALTLTSPTMMCAQEEV